MIVESKGKLAGTSASPLYMLMRIVAVMLLLSADIAAAAM
jgi:hypothetical protein